MNPPERFKACMRFQTVDRCPLKEWAPWAATITRWMNESGHDQNTVLSYLRDCDPECVTDVDFSMNPPFKGKTLSEDEETIVRRDRMGVTYREFKQNPETSMPEFIGFPVKSPAEWKMIKHRFDPSTPGRYPADWNERVGTWKTENPVLRYYGLVASYYGGPSLYGFVRMLLGDERVLYAFYDEPEMVHDMMETATEFSMAMLRKALTEAPVTLVQFWEDMCYRGGPLIAPDMFRTFMMPRYKRITDLIRSLNVDIIFVDSDGKVDELIPLWLESGINGVFPMEQAAGNDIHAYRRKFGRNLLMTGGIDKRVLARGKAAIDQELKDKLSLVDKGGYVPMLDHSIPPDVSYDNFCYYWKQKKRLLGMKTE